MTKSLADTLAIQRESDGIAALRMELVEEMNGLGPIGDIYRAGECPQCGSIQRRHRRGGDCDSTWHNTQPECTCDRDPLGVCPVCGGWSDNVLDEAEYGLAVSVWNAALAGFLAELETSSGAHCLNCKATENLRDGDECWPCYDKRMVDSEAFARHGGDV